MSKQPDGRKRAEKVKKRAAEKKHAEQRLNQAARAKSVRGELAPLDDIEPFDRRLMEREMARLIGGEATAGTTAELQQAQELTYQAMEAPTPDQARKLAWGLVEKRLAACVNVLPKADSFHWWQNERQVTEESVLLIKTTQSKLDLLVEHIRAEHSYELPEIIALPVTVGLPEYMNWILEETGTRG